MGYRGAVTEIPLWQQRFLATRIQLPQFARYAEQRALYRSNATGVEEIYLWDRSTDTHRQATNRKNGTRSALIAPDGEHFWWFNDTDGDEHGHWMRQHFASGQANKALADVPDGYSAGLALGRELVVVGVSNDDGSTLYAQVNGKAHQIYQHEQDAGVGDVSSDDTLIAISHSEHGDSLHPDLRVLRADGSTVAELSDGPGKELYPAEFSPLLNDHRLLVNHERAGRTELLLWDPLSKDVRELHIDLPGEISGTWYPDASALLVIAHHNARSTMHRYDLADETLTSIDTYPGIIEDAHVSPSGAVHYQWSNAEKPNQILELGTGILLKPTGNIAPGSAPIEDHWVPGPGGDIHVLAAAPGPGTWPTIFSVHGGPHAADEDAFDAWRAAYLDSGYAVIQVNYRGSTGYGSAWRDAIIGKPGHTELADIAAVHQWAVDRGLADPQRCVISGYSWGGYLTLLGLGTQPERWAAGVAGVPVADYLAAYEDEMEALKAMDRVLFGGAPHENPEPWLHASPIEYVTNVKAPVLILAGANDSRCPLRQIENYVSRLEELNKPHEVFRFDAGHGSLVTADRIRMVQAELDFLAKHVAPRSVIG
ncbi:MAG: S9 family peptidase [Corynebacteriales bacterium]|nr:S9 family peptidase [Mycobacteriales bacterium]